jgi:hypothetical protein
MNTLFKRIITSTAFVALLAFGSFSYAQGNTKNVANTNMTRQEWLKLPQQEQRMALRNMSGESKYKFWQDKFKETKQLNWSKEELKHIKKVEDFFTENKAELFLDKDKKEEGLKKLDTFQKQWIEEGEKSFGWSKDLMFHIIADGGTFTNQMLESLRK